MELPKALDRWDASTLRQLISEQISESDTLDYKELIKAGKDPVERIEYQRMLSSFANTEGGFIVFGIAEDKTQPNPYSIKGITLNEEPQIVISRYIGNLNPTIKFRHLKLDVDGKTVIVVKVDESFDKPVICSDGSCYIRLNGYKQPMSRKMLSDYFLTRDMRMVRLSKLKFELIHMYRICTPDKFVPEAPPVFAAYRIQQLFDSISDCNYLFEDDMDASNILWNMGKSLMMLCVVEQEYWRLVPKTTPEEYAQFNSIINRNQHGASVEQLQGELKSNIEKFMERVWGAPWTTIDKEYQKKNV